MASSVFNSLYKFNTSHTTTDLDSREISIDCARLFMA